MAPLNSSVSQSRSKNLPRSSARPRIISRRNRRFWRHLVNNEAFYRVSDFLEPAPLFSNRSIRRSIKLARDLIRAGKLATPVTLKTFLDGNTDHWRPHCQSISGGGLAAEGDDDHQCRRLRAYGLRPVISVVNAHPGRRGYGQCSRTMRLSIFSARLRSKTPNEGYTNWRKPVATIAGLPAFATAHDRSGRSARAYPARRYRHRHQPGSRPHDGRSTALRSDRLVVPASRAWASALACIAYNVTFRAGAARWPWTRRLRPILWNRLLRWKWSNAHDHIIAADRHPSGKSDGGISSSSK